MTPDHAKAHRGQTLLRTAHSWVVASWSEEASFGTCLSPGWQVLLCDDSYYDYAIDDKDVVAWVSLPEHTP